MFAIKWYDYGDRLIPDGVKLAIVLILLFDYSKIL